MPVIAEKNLYTFTSPPPDRIAWRYMTLAKLLALVLDKELYLARLDQLPDKLEGQHTAAEGRWMEGLTTSVRNRLPYDDETQPGRLHGSMHPYDRAQRYRGRLYVNCWHVGDDTENEAMWRIYGAGETGLAIKVSTTDLVGSIPADENIKIGMVDYRRNEELELDKGRPVALAGPFAVGMHKRMEFGYESELRIIQKHADVDAHEVPDGFKVFRTLAWDPLLIRQIVISPYAAPWVSQLIGRVIKPHCERLASRIVLSSMRA